MSTSKDQFLKNLDVQAMLGNQDVEANISKDLPMRKWLYAWLLDPNIPGNYQKSLDKWISLLIIANLFSLMFEHVPAVFEPNQLKFEIFDIFSVIVFTIEYVLRLYLAPEDEEFKGRKQQRPLFPPKSACIGFSKSVWWNCPSDI